MRSLISFPAKLSSAMPNRDKTIYCQRKQKKYASNVAAQSAPHQHNVAKAHKHPLPQETKSFTKELAPTDFIAGPENLLKTGFTQKGLSSGW